jgi:excisionase family DNA binding protein
VLRIYKMPDTEYLTVEEVATRLRRVPNTIRRWLRSGMLSGVAVGRKYLISVESLRTLERESKTKREK